jgi:hypothetical protein
MELIKRDVLLWPKHFDMTEAQMNEGICLETSQGDMAFLPTKDGRALKISPDCSGYNAWVKAPYGVKFEATLI